MYKNEENLEDFEKGNWCNEIDVRDFIQKNYKEYTGESSFLKGPTDRTKKIWNKIEELLKEEIKKDGVLEADTNIISSITSHNPGYIDKDNELIVGLQTDKPLKRALIVQGGVRLVEKALNEYGYEIDPKIVETFTKYRKTHNQGVYDVYTSEIRKARKSGIITGLPDSYGRGRIIGDYRRVALYGVDTLIEDKTREFKELEVGEITENTIKLREEITEQVNALKELKQMALSYGFDISNPATNAKEAIQWLYFAYLAAIKEQNGAAMSLGRVSTFLDIYIERDLKNNKLTEEQAQELIDDFVIKLRIVRFLRAREYTHLFAGDPNWVTESIGGMATDDKSLVTKNSYRILQTLYNLGPAPEPNLTVLWSNKLPENFRKFCAKVSCDTSAIQYENDDLMRPHFGDDYGIACCVSAMRIGKQMQFFGARCNLVKALLYAINRGKDEISGDQIVPLTKEFTSDILDYDDIMERLEDMFDYLSRVYVNALNIIHYMHDKYSYEKLQMSLHDKDIVRTMAAGVAGLSVIVDSLSAIKYAKVKCIKDERGIVTDFEVEGDYPCFGNNDDRVDEIALKVQKMFMDKLKKHKTYRDSIHTMSILTITSNVVYGEKTGTTPDGRKKGSPFAPGANPMYHREKKGIISAFNSMSKLDYEESLDGISYTFSVVPNAIGKNIEERSENMKLMLDEYFRLGGHHININVLDREKLIDAMEHPEKYPTLTIRVSGYAVNFIKLSKKHQLDVISRTFHN